MKKNIIELHDAAMELNSAAFHYRSFTAMNKALPKYEYETKTRGDHKLPDGTYRKPKTLPNHPTKKVAKSLKLKLMEERQTLALVRLRNARDRYSNAERAAYGSR